MMMLVLAMLAQVAGTSTTPVGAPPPVAVAAPHDTGPGDDPRAEAVGDEGAWITSDDYPPQALREGRFGTSGTELSIGRDGRVLGCTIVASSGSADLDAAACALLVQRGQFRPARNRRGRPVASLFNRRVVWRMPYLAPVIEPVAGFRNARGIIARYHVTRDGVVDDCRVMDAAASSAPQSHPEEAGICAMFRSRASETMPSTMPAEGMWFEQREMTYVYMMDPGWSEQGNAPDTAPPPAPPAEPLPDGVT